MIAGFRCPLFILGLSVATAAPPTPPPTPPATILQRGGAYATRRYEDEQYELWIQHIVEQNADDLEVVKILTEFLSRIS